jgi:EAL domain-containing protein (putative c-di-GMP-specific phosphodiesterase class I)
MPPGCLELEITESIAMDDPAAVRERLGALRELGVLIAIDDFGTGYSSLGHLQSLPIDFLKIDRAFVIDIGGHGRGLFAGTIVDFCKKLNVLSIAEGVESVEQSDFLRSVGCDIVQGYMYGRPMAPEVLTEWLRSRASGDMAR